VRRFFQELPRHFREIGQVAPSSRLLARKLVEPVRKGEGPRRILEVGAGTGSITAELIRALAPGDTLIVCEINNRLLKLLKVNLRRDPECRARLHQVEFYNSPVQELRLNQDQGSLSVIISSLPFSNFSPEMVREILDLYAYLLKEDGVLCFYEYVGLRKLGQPFRSPSERKRVREVARVIREWRDSRSLEGKLNTSLTLLNFPPARTLVGRY
jgi:phospholipid N-methyltransferase